MPFCPEANLTPDGNWPSGPGKGKFSYLAFRRGPRSRRAAGVESDRLDAFEATKSTEAHNREAFDQMMRQLRNDDEDAD